MAINLWRYVEYTDDGCALYQCLRCYGKWEGRGEPGYTHHETGEYHACWHFCPLCGTHWDGKRETRPGQCDKPLGPRRMRVLEAMERLRRGWFGSEWPDERQAPFYWLLEVRQATSYFGKPIEQQPWSVQNWIKGLSMPAAAVLAHARLLEQQMQENVEERLPIFDEDEMKPLEWTTQVRITTSKTRPSHGSELRRPLNP